MSFQHKLAEALENLAANARADRRYAEAWDLDNARDILIYDQAGAAIDEFDCGEGCDERIDKWLADYFERTILALPDAAVETYCDGLLADPDIVAKYMSAENIMKLAASELNADKLRELADEIGAE